MDSAVAKYPRNHSVQSQLDSFRSDKPTCAEYKAGAVIRGFLADKDESGRTRMEAILQAKYEHLLKNPKDIDLKELMGAAAVEERAMAQPDRKGSALAELFQAFDDSPEAVQEVVPEGEEVR